MQITEPVTMATDFALGAAGLYFGLRLLFLRGPKNRTTSLLWSTGFMASGFAAITGGAYHGFTLMLEPSTLRSLWNVTTVSIGAGGAFMIAGVVASSIRRHDESRSWLRRGLFLTLGGFAIQATGFRQGLDFNHNDAFHVIQTAALYLFFRGASRLEDRGAAISPPGRLP